MEFADLIHEHLKDKGIKAHIQPHWGTPSLWERGAYKDIEFGPEMQLRAVMIGSSRLDRIVIFYHPSTEQVYIKYWKAHRLTKSEIKRIRKNERLLDHRKRQIQWIQAWHVFPLADPDALFDLVEFVEYVLLTYKMRLKNPGFVA